MIISDTKKFVFIHVPKAGGSSVRAVLNPYATVIPWQHRVGKLHGSKNKLLTKHVSASVVRKHIGVHNWSDYFSFAFVRNPWDRVVSNYFYARTHQALAKHKIARAKSFTDFVLWYAQEGALQKSNKFKLVPGAAYVSYGNKKIVSFLGKFESLERDFLHVCKRLKIMAQLPHVNRSVHKPYRDYYIKRTREVVAKLFAQDIHMFGYRF